MPTLLQWFFGDIATTGTNLTGIGRVYFHYLTNGACSLLRKNSTKLRPSRERSQLYYTTFRKTHLQRGFTAKVPLRGTRLISPSLKQGVLRRESIINKSENPLLEHR